MIVSINKYGEGVGSEVGSSSTNSITRKITDHSDVTIASAACLLVSPRNAEKIKFNAADAAAAGSMGSKMSNALQGAYDYHKNDNTEICGLSGVGEILPMMTRGRCPGKEKACVQP
jgi:hypothetical protein